MKKQGQLARIRGVIQEAARQFELGNLDMAGQIVQNILKQVPDYPEAMCLMGRILLEKGDTHNAVNVLADAHRMDMENDFLTALYGGACIAVNRAEYALELVNNRIKPDTTDVNLLFTRAHALETLTDFAAAYSDCKRLVALAPKNTQYWYQLAHCCRELGFVEEFDQATEQSFLNGDRSGTIVHRLLIGSQNHLFIDARKCATDHLENSTKKSSDDEYIDRLIALELASSANEKTKALEALIVSGKKQFHANLKPFEVAQAQRAEALKRLRGAKSINGPKPDPNLPTSVFILGPSRAGKSTVETMLDKSENVKSWLETQVVTRALRKTLAARGNPLNVGMSELSKNELEDVRNRYFDILSNSREFTHFTYTNPTNIYTADLQYRFLPNTKFVLVSRDDEDTVFRQFTYRYGKGNVHAFDLDATREYIAWYRAMQTELKRLFGRNVYEISYEELVQDTRSAMNGVERFLGLAEQSEYPKIGDDRGYAGQFPDFLLGS